MLSVFMRRRPRFHSLPHNLKKWSFLILIICSFIVITLYTQRDGTKPRAEEILENCQCVDADGNTYDFCYHLPEDRSIRARRFFCKHLPIIKKFGLLDTYKLPLTWKPSPPVFVTAFSENHQNESLNLIKSVAQHFINQRMIVYDLGNVDLDLFKEWKFLEFRKFNFDEYPAYVKSLREFRWKPLIIAETLLEFGAIWYMDSSVVFKKGDLNHVYELVKCRETVKERPPLLSSEERDERENRTPLESDWDIPQYRENLAECRKAACLLHKYTGYGIYPATSPIIYEYFPTNKEEIKKPKAKMYDANLIFVAQTKDTVEQILKWLVLCALEEGCMAGMGGETSFCDFKNFFSHEPTCHRVLAQMEKETERPSLSFCMAH
ncbi:unnamed protein product [Cylicocyclus nassatus]|uniref:Uncharacterized protein n=1 Tax=Cylicocyclus nassatus TaxID=53992 RepID=A0AA36DTX7_CYLNA|nr:unnamed protein product [Cylicocyclus nassatus]